MFLLQLYAHAEAESIKFSATRDVWISAYPGEENYNMGASDELKLKGIQEMAILDFDLSKLRGKQIENARLYMHDAGNKNKLKNIGISTVASPWVEGRSKGNSVDIAGKGATFLYSSYKSQRWAGERSDLTDVTMGKGNTWQHHTEIKREDGRWWSVDIAPDVIYALVNGKSHGLLIMDESGQTFANNYVSSMESGSSSPYIMLNTTDVQMGNPKRPDAELIPSLINAHMNFGAVVLHVPIKEKYFAFDLFINNEHVPLWRVPKPGAVNSVQQIIIDWLPPEKKVDVKIIAVSETGQRSEPAFASGYSSRALSKIDFPEYKPGNHSTVTFDSNGAALRIWGLPDLTKVEPVTGEILVEGGLGGYDVNNPAWSADKRHIMLSGIKGEVTGFQLCIEGDSKALGSIEVRMPKLTSVKGEVIADKQFGIYQVHYLKARDKWYPELLIPMKKGRIEKYSALRPVENQRNQLLYVDLSIPPDAVAGDYYGDIIVLKDGVKVNLVSVKLSVADILMPRKLSFVPELNMYMGPGVAGTERFFNAHRIANENRMVINRVPYSQDGTVHRDMIPKITYLNNDEVKIDWSDYDRNLGPLFDGTVFTGSRKGIPVERFYLPFFENWPMPISANYKYQYSGRKTDSVISDHATRALSIDSSFSKEYKERFSNVVREFVKHVRQKGWEQTEFQFYLNNKWDWDGSSSWWDLDEPMSFDDWMALRFYGMLFKQAAGSAPSNFIFRADISRPQWQGGWLNTILDRMYVQSVAFFDNTDRVRQFSDDSHSRFSVYGSLNDIDKSDQETVQWCMRTYVEGADGVLPWQSIGSPTAFIQPDKNALIVDAKDITGYDWVVSRRIKALRRCQQNVELMKLVEQKNGYKREQIRDLFYRYFGDVEADSSKMEYFRIRLISMLN